MVENKQHSKKGGILDTNHSKFTPKWLYWYFPAFRFVTKPKEKKREQEGRFLVERVALLYVYPTSSCFQNFPE